MTNLDVWYAHVDMTEVRAQFDTQLLARQRKYMDKGLAKARTRDSKGAGQADPDRRRPPAHHPRSAAPGPHRRSADPAETARADLEGDFTGLLAKYQRTLETDRRYLLQQFEFCDMARKVVGVGSVGTRCWIVLMLGRDEADPLFLAGQGGRALVLSRFVGASKYANQGQRVVAGQRLMQASSDIFLAGSVSRQAWTGSPGTSTSGSLRTGNFLSRSGRCARKGSAVRRAVRLDAGPGARAVRGDRIAIAAYLGGSDVFDRAIAKFASVYADQNERDYQALVDAVKSGRITAEQGL